MCVALSAPLVRREVHREELAAEDLCVCIVSSVVKYCSFVMKLCMY